MIKIYFDNYEDIAEYILDNYNANENDKLYSVSICAPYTCIMNILDIISVTNYEIDNIIDEKELDKTHPECILSIINNLITVENLWNKSMYKEHYGNTILVFSDCKSSILRKFDAIQMIEFDLIENNEKFEGKIDNKTTICSGNFSVYKKNKTLNTSYCVKFDCSHCDYNTICGFKTNMMNMFLI